MKTHDSGLTTVPAADPDLTELNRLLAEAVAPLPIPGGQRAAARSRLMDRIGKSVAEHAGLMTVRLKDGLWRNLRKGVRFKPLWTGPGGNSVLIEFAPGAALPVHRHHWLEEGIVIQGGLQMGDLDLGPLDYHVSPAGSRHQAISSRQGALAYLRGTSLGDQPAMWRELLGGLMPLSGQPARTVYSNGPEWRDLGGGVSTKEVWRDGGLVSSFCRLEPGASVPAHDHSRDEECMMLEGELFLGDILLKTGEYQLAPAGSRHGEISTDVGATLFVRGAMEDYPR
jgi:quercetin dioxygenase-like cupin family protein